MFYPRALIAILLLRIAHFCAPKELKPFIYKSSVDSIVVYLQKLENYGK